MTDGPDDRINFSPLDPTVDAARFQGAVAGVVDAAAFELARRHHRAGTVRQLARWQGPMAAAAAIAVIVSSVILSRVADADQEPQALSFAEYIGVPTQVAQWVGEDEFPLAQEILFLMENGSR